MTAPVTPPAVARAEALLTRVIATLGPLALRTKVTLKTSELRLLLDTITEARQEVRSLVVPPNRAHAGGEP